MPPTDRTETVTGDAQEVAPLVIPHRYTKPYLWSVVAIGAAVSVFSAYRLISSATATTTLLDWQLLLLIVVTIFLGHRLIVRIPNGNGEVTVVDTFIFITLLLYSGDAAILLASAEALFSRARFNRKLVTVLFSGAVFACATFFTVWLLRLSFGPVEAFIHDDSSTTLFVKLCVMALAQYLVNSILVAIGVGLKTNQSIWRTWSRYYLWASMTYFVGAAAAGVTAKLVVVIGFYGFLVTAPIIAFTYLTYRMYMTNVEAATRHLEQSERHIAELSHYIAEQERMREQFSQVERLSALGELASGVAHDFNNKLASILGHGQLLLEDVRDPKTKRRLEIIIQAAMDGARTIKRIQDFARQRRDYDLAPVVVDQLFDDVREITRPRWKDQAAARNVHIDLEVRSCPGLTVNGDAAELRDVFINMIFNAVDAMPAGGRITLSAEMSGERALIIVADTGVGMSAEVSSRIFDPFFTTKGTDGVGLGLAVTYGVIRRHEGSIEVETELGRGTTFRITLPIAESAAPSAQQTEEPGMGLTMVGNAQVPKILIVDDDDYVRDLLQEILEAEGYDITTAKNGSEAHVAFKAMRFDAVFTDVAMPGISGWELARMIREQNDGVYIAVITGWGAAVGTEEQIAARIDRVLTKPFDVNEIVKVASEIPQYRTAREKGRALLSIVA
ncbi:MAG: response regulator [Acidobacteriota bacterium]|nr:response regulator [Acidobacteriota bacterium]